MINRVVLVGRLTKDPEMRYTNSNKAVCNFTIAVNGYKKDDVDFINIICWEKQAENVSKYCRKGALVGVDGSIKTRTYEAQDGTKRYVMEVLAQSVKFLESKSNQEQPNEQSDPFANSNSIEVTEDSLPF